MLYSYRTNTRVFRGQVFPGRTIYARKEILDRVSKVPEAIITEGWRSQARQDQLLAQGKSRTRDSNHIRGAAIDVWNWDEVLPSGETVADKLRRHGLDHYIWKSQNWDAYHFTLYPEHITRSRFARIPSFNPSEVKEYVVRQSVVQKIQTLFQPMNIEQARQEVVRIYTDFYKGVLPSPAHVNTEAQIMVERYKNQINGAEALKGAYIANPSVYGMLTFDYVAYAMSHQDLKDKFGITDAESAMRNIAGLREHYIQFGAREGREYEYQTLAVGGNPQPLNGLVNFAVVQLEEVIDKIKKYQNG